MNVDKSHTYYLKSTLYEKGVEVIDKTKGIVKAMVVTKIPFMGFGFDEIEYGPNCYRITVDDKEVRYRNDARYNFILHDCKKITLEKDIKESNLIKITHIDAIAMEVFYVDSDMVNGLDQTYRILNYKPEDISKDSANKKIARLQKDHPSVKLYTAAFNRHGVCALGDKDNKEKRAFYYATPQEEIMSRIDSYVQDQHEIVTVRGGHVFFSDTRGELYLNDGPAERLFNFTSSGNLLEYYPTKFQKFN